MKRQKSMQQEEMATQLSLFESQEREAASSLLEALERLEAQNSTPQESHEEFERRRVREMAEKVGWPAVKEGPVRRWPGVEIAEGEPAWRTFFAEADSDTIGVVGIGLHRQLNPLTYGCIDEATGLCCYPVEVMSQVEERERRRMIQLAEVLGWPLVTWWVGKTKESIGPGEAIWQNYFVSGAFGRIIDAVEALERKLRGEPEQGKRAVRYWASDDEEDEF